MILESNLTLTSEFTVGAEITSSQVNRSDSAVFAVDFVGLSKASQGIIYEQGGAFNGFVVYIDDNQEMYVWTRLTSNTFVSAPDSNSSWVHITGSDVPQGDGTLVWDINQTTKAVRVYWNDVEIGAPTNNVLNQSGDWAGGDAGVFLNTLTTDVPFSDSNSNTNGIPSVTYTSASSLRYYSDQTVGNPLITEPPPEEIINMTAFAKYPFTTKLTSAPLARTLLAGGYAASIRGGQFNYSGDGVLVTSPFGVSGSPEGGVLTEDSQTSNIILETSGVLGTHFSAFFGLVFRYIDADNCFALQYRRQGELVLLKLIDGVQTNLTGGLASGDRFPIPSFNRATKYKLKISVVDDNIIGYLDDVEIFNVTDTDLNTATRHGLLAIADSVRVDYLDITTPYGSKTRAVGELLGKLDIQTTDNLPASGQRTIDIFNLADRKRVDTQDALFSDGASTITSNFIYEGEEVLAYSADTQDLSATTAIANHQIVSPWPERPSKIFMVLANGQSNAVGTNAWEIVNTGVNYNGLLFNEVNSHGNEDKPVENVQVTDFRYFVNDVVETHGYGFIESFTDDRRSEGDNSVVLWATNGIGGRLIKDLLDPAQASMKNGLLFIEAAQALGQNKRLDIDVIMTWDQGESDLDTNALAYTNDLIALHTAYRNKVNQELGQTELPLITCGIGSENYFGGRRDFTEINNALYQYTLNTVDAYYASPKYYEAFAHGSPDGVHYNPSGFIIQGEHEALVAARIIKSKEAGDNPPVARVLEPTGYSVSGNIITVAMHVPTAPIVFDTTLLPEMPSYGVAYEQADGTKIAPTVTTDGNSLFIDVGTPPQEGDIIQWGKGGDGDGFRHQTTNIRDSQNIPSAVDGVFLYNWLPCHYHTLLASEV